MFKLVKFAAHTLLLVGMTALAQDADQSTPPPASTPPTHHQLRGDQAEHRLKRLSKRLSLTDDQKEKLRPILQDEEKQTKAVDDDASLTAQQKHHKMREIRMSSRSQMDSILTDEQKKKLGNNGPHGTGQHHGRRRQINPGTTNPSTTTPDQNDPQ